MSIDLNSIDSIVNGIDFESNKFETIGNNLMLTKREINILKKYKVNYMSCNSLKEIIFEIEELLSDMDIVDEELEYVSQSIAERDYYQNTNK